MSVTIATSTEINSRPFAGVSYNISETLVRQAEQRRSRLASTHPLTMSNSALVFSRTYPRQELLTETG